MFTINYEIKKKVEGRKLLLIAPGKSVLENKEEIQQFIAENNPVIISINHNDEIIETDFIFISNIRRFSQLSKSVYEKTISTSNIKTKETYASIDYYQLLNAVDAVRDNAGLMAIKFVINELEPTDIYVAGLDGYSKDAHIHYESDELMVYMSDKLLSQMNEGMKIVLSEYRKLSDIKFITPSILV